MLNCGEKLPQPRKDARRGASLRRQAKIFQPIFFQKKIKSLNFKGRGFFIFSEGIFHYCTTEKAAVFTSLEFVPMKT